MRCKVQVVMETGSGESVHEIARLDREAGGLESIGLTLAEAKTLWAEIQAVVVQQQAAEYLKRHQHCPACGKGPAPQRGARADLPYLVWQPDASQSPFVSLHLPAA
jgi:hypothetical protein